MTEYITWFFAAWAMGSVAGWKVKMITRAFYAA
jgi:hypothetical protein